MLGKAGGRTGSLFAVTWIKRENRIISKQTESTSSVCQALQLIHVKIRDLNGLAKNTNVCSFLFLCDGYDFASFSTVSLTTSLFDTLILLIKIGNRTAATLVKLNYQHLKVSNEISARYPHAIKLKF